MRCQMNITALRINSWFWSGSGEKKGLYYPAVHLDILPKPRHLSSYLRSTVPTPLCAPFQQQFVPSYFPSALVHGQGTFTFWVKEQSRGFAGWPRDVQATWAKVVLITPSATIEFTSSSGNFLLGKADPYVVNKSLCCFPQLVWKWKRWKFHYGWTETWCPLG